MVTALKSVVFLIVIPGTVFGLVPCLLVTRAPEVYALPIGSLRYLGPIGIALGLAALVWCVYDFAARGRGTPAPIDPPKELVVQGLYRHVRNPMYVAMLTVLLGEAVLFRSTTLLLYAAYFFLMFSAFIRFYEEPHLRKTFGDAYERYCESVPRWVPRIRGL
jgi:protein-S-isoprenylcysteine O-methyltransferase Ste14